MKDHLPLFPCLGAESHIADVQVRQTMAMGLLPLGIVLLLSAAASPDWPPPSLWVGAALTLGGMALLWGLWRRSGRRHLCGFSTAHFLIRYLFIVLCPVLLWSVFGGIILDQSGIWPPLLLGLLLLVYPAGRVLRERIGSDPAAAPHAEMAHIVCQQIEKVLGVFALMGLVFGAILDANQDLPTDPTAILLVLWMLGLLTLLASAVIGAGHWARIYGKSDAIQALDDAPPPATPKTPLRFGSEKF